MEKRTKINKKGLDFEMNTNTHYTLQIIYTTSSNKRRIRNETKSNLALLFLSWLSLASFFVVKVSNKAQGLMQMYAYNE